MKQLDLSQMENVQGGAASASACKAMATIAYVAGIGSFFGPVGALIFGPTAIVVGGVGLAVC